MNLIFQSTRPVRGATGKWWRSVHTSTAYFNPRAPCGRDQRRRYPRRCRNHFNPRAPCGRDCPSSPAEPSTAYFNPRAPCGRDQRAARKIDKARHFNPRAPCGRDTETPWDDENKGEFQSTRPVRARLSCRGRRFRLFLFQSTRPVRARHRLSSSAARSCVISIHAPRAGAT